MDLLQDPRYKDTPVYLFFENYVLNVTGALPADKQDILQNINLQEIFSTQSSNWKDAVKEVLHLSSTIDIAIMYQWHLYLEKTDSESQEPNSQTFSRSFVDAYFTKDSKIDVWTEESLMVAKRYIQENQSLLNATS